MMQERCNSSSEARQARGELRVLLVGPHSALISGTCISFRQLARALDSLNGNGCTVLNTCGVRGAGVKGLMRFAALAFRVVTLSRTSDVITLHCSITGLPFVGPLILFAAWLRRRPVVFRGFGGMFYGDLRGVKKALCRWFVGHCELYLVQTKELLGMAQKDGILHVGWLPTCRPRAEESRRREGPSCCRGRYVYVGHLRREKGLQLLLEAVERASFSVTIDVYGPWRDVPRDMFERCRRSVYRGTLAPDDVAATIEKYDALVLPSILADEGYPGVVLEAYSVGRPVIASRWKALPEIVIEGETGLLFEPGNVSSLRACLGRLLDDQQLYRHMAVQAYEFGARFTVAAQASLFLAYCHAVIKGDSERLWGAQRDVSAH